MQIIESEGGVGTPEFVASLSDMQVALGPLKSLLVSEVRGVLTWHCPQLWNQHKLWAVNVKTSLHPGTPPNMYLLKEKKIAKNWQLRVITNHLGVDLLIFIICCLSFWRFSSGTCCLLDEVTGLPVLSFLTLSDVVVSPSAYGIIVTITAHCMGPGVLLTSSPSSVPSL